MILFYGGWLTGRDIVTVGTLAAFVLYLQNLFEPIQQMSQLFNTIQAAGAALQKLYGLLDEDVEIDERPGAVDLPGDGRARSRRRLVPLRERSAVLDDVSLEVTPGQRLALVGPDRRGQVDAREADGAVLRPGRRSGALRRRRPARRDACTRCASASSWCPRKASSSAGTSATTC